MNDCVLQNTGVSHVVHIGASRLVRRRFGFPDLTILTIYANGLAKGLFFFTCFSAVCTAAMLLLHIGYDLFLPALVIRWQLKFCRK